MGIRGMDVSNYQSDADIETLVRSNGLDFVFVLANDGTVVNSAFGAQVAAARRAGALVAAYLYQRPNWQDTLNTFRSVVGTDVPAIVDVESGSGDVSVTRAIHSGLWSAGYRTPLLYLPTWYWQQIGSPDLTGLPPLWKSWYPDAVSRGFDAGVAMLPSYVWNSYGGLDVTVVQFTGTGALDGYAGSLDLNYFPGSRAALATLLGGSSMSLFDDKTTNPVTNQETSLGEILRWICAERIAPLVWDGELVNDEDIKVTPSIVLKAIDTHLNKLVTQHATDIAALSAKLDAVTTALAKVSTAQVDPAALAAAVQQAVQAALKTPMNITVNNATISGTSTMSNPEAG